MQDCVTLNSSVKRANWLVGKPRVNLAYSASARTTHRRPPKGAFVKRRSYLSQAVPREDGSALRAVVCLAFPVVLRTKAR